MNKTLQNRCKTLNILCADDEDAVLEVYTSLFSLLFLNVYSARDGEEALQIFQEQDIDIVLTDYQMPRMDGIVLSKKIRDIDASIPIIMVTALESLDMLREAIEINVTSFLKKPFTQESLLSAFNLAVKSVIYDRDAIKEQKRRLEYSDYQERLTFEKETLIAKNDLEEKELLFDFKCEVFYKPLDVLSGDSYIIKKVANGYLLFLVDGMGKGISASATAMLCSSFVNYYINSLQKSKQIFELKIFLQELYAFIAPNLLEDEVVSLSVLHFKDKKRLEYAIYSMPPFFLMENNNKIERVLTNNLPMSSYYCDFNVQSIDLARVVKILLYTDGLNENSLEEEAQTYGRYLEEDFIDAKSKHELYEKMNTKIINQEDDVTFIYLQRYLDE